MLMYVCVKSRSTGSVGCVTCRKGESGVWVYVIMAWVCVRVVFEIGFCCKSKMCSVGV